MTNIKACGTRLAWGGTLFFGVATSLLAPSPASAALVSGTATITIDNTAFSAASANAGIGFPNGWPVRRFWDSTNNTTGINLDTAGGTTFEPAGSAGPMVLPVNTNTSTIGYPSAGARGRTVQATTMDASDTSSGQIGLSGAWLLSSPPAYSAYLSPYDFSLVKTGGTWDIRTYDTSYGYNNFLELANVSESLNGNGELLLSGDLKWASGAWAAMVGGANTSTLVGTFSLAPSAVPVPAAVWLFGSAMAGLFGIARRRAIGS